MTIAERWAPQVEEPLPRPRLGDLTLSGCLLALVIITVPILNAPLPLNLAPADLAIIVSCGLGLRAMLVGACPPMRRAFQRSVPWFWLLLVATGLSLLAVGFPFWAVDHTIRDFIAPFSFFPIAALLWCERRFLPWFLRLWVIMGVLVALSILVGAGGELRSTSIFFDNPNYAGSYLATSLVVLAATSIRLPIRLVAGGLMVAALLDTGSFGGMTVILGALMFIPLQEARSLPGGAKWVTRILLVVIAILVGLTAMNDFAESDSDLGSGANSTRFNRSAETRGELWRTGVALVPDNPLGVGPSALKKRRDLSFKIESVRDYKRPEMHNDYLAFLVETGPLGFAAYVGILASVWLAIPKTSPARALLLGFLISALFHEQVNFRHVWFSLALLTPMVGFPWRPRPIGRLVVPDRGANAADAGT